MSEETIPFTREGYEQLLGELDRLKKIERPTIIQDIEEARAHGDLKENAEYHAAKERQGFVEARISDLEDKLARARVIEYSNEENNIVRFAAYVKVNDEETSEEKTYRIVGDLEADIHLNKISVSSPLAKALLGKTVGDLVEVRAPKGIREYAIIEVRY